MLSVVVKKNMKNKLYIVTGGSNGFGRSIVLSLLEKNHFVISLSRSQLQSEDVEMYGATFFQYKIDFSKSFSTKVNSLLKKATGKIGLKNISQVILINNAAIVGPIDRIEKLNEKDIAAHMQVNLSAPILMTQVFLNLISKFKGEKVVVQITSGAAVNPMDGWALYCSAKAGLNMFNQVLMTQFKQDQNFKAIGYSPGVMDTNMQVKLRQAKKSQFPNVDDFKKYKNEKQLRTPDYVAGDLLRILSDFRALTTGQVYRVS
jgi:benzil reductase ((S)-benzoin forming)